MEATTYVWFHTNDKDGNIIKSYENCPCYSDITCYGTVALNCLSITTYIDKKYVPFSEEEVVKWISYLKEFGFLVEYDGLKGDSFYFTVPVYRNNVPLSKVECLSILILIRYLWENGINKFPKNFFKKLEKEPDTDKFLLLQTLHNKRLEYANTGHMLHWGATLGNLTKEGFWEEISKETNNIFSSNFHFSVSELWSRTNLK